ncbi:hypothetical protein, partial [Streptomyces graminilatus]|uniref:hypothetical protein n=1 Tax=Streptomyces graminilatus TaxID=1464070 RepID=UPI0012FE81C7
MTVEIYFVRTDPVQEVAAEPATLDLLRDILRPKAVVETRAAPELLTAARAASWPLVYDDKIPPGYVHCRPTPGAASALRAAEIEECWRALIPGEEHRQPIKGALDGIRHALTDMEFTSKDPEPAFVWPRQHGKSALTIEATFQQTDAMKSLFAWADAHVRGRQQAMVARLADEFDRPRFLVRRQFYAVQHVLEAAGIGDGYGNLTVPQPVR